jgi:hypothetical protein
VAPHLTAHGWLLAPLPEFFFSDASAKQLSIGGVRFMHQRTTIRADRIGKFAPRPMK